MVEARGSQGAQNVQGIKAQPGATAALWLEVPRPATCLKPQLRGAAAPGRLVPRLPQAAPPPTTLRSMSRSQRSFTVQPAPRRIWMRALCVCRWQCCHGVGKARRGGVNTLHSAHFQGLRLSHGP
jgi:hypothetical protein